MSASRRCCAATMHGACRSHVCGRARPSRRTTACVPRAAPACPRCTALQAHERKWRSDGTAPASCAATASLTTTFTLHQRARDAAASSTPSSGVMNGAARRIPDDMPHTSENQNPNAHSRTRARGLCGSGRRVDRRGSAQRAGRSFGWPCVDAAGSRRRYGGDAWSATAPNRVREPCAQGTRGTREGWRVVLGRGGTGRAGAHMSWTGGSSTQSATVASCTASYLTTPQPIDPQPREPLSRWVAHSNKSWPRRRTITRGNNAWRTRSVARI